MVYHLLISHTRDWRDHTKARNLGDQQHTITKDSAGSRRGRSRVAGRLYGSIPCDVGYAILKCIGEWASVYSTMRTGIGELVQFQSLVCFNMVKKLRRHA